jgi:hypothetical protein
MSSPGSKTKKPMDIVVKLALGVLIGSFTLIWGGMYLSRPDRSIPPYTVGSQLRHLVAAHVPRGTTDEEVERLLKRFRKVSHQTHDFGSMKIYPTTPGDPGGRYARILIYVFDDAGWTDPEKLEKYVAGDAAVVREYERSVRGYYRLQDREELAGIGSLSMDGKMPDDGRILFKGRVTDPLPVEAEPETGISISPM